MTVPHHARIVALRAERIEERDDALGAEVLLDRRQRMETEDGRILIVDAVDLVADDDAELGEVLGVGDFFVRVDLPIQGVRPACRGARLRITDLDERGFPFDPGRKVPEHRQPVAG